MLISPANDRDEEDINYPSKRLFPSLSITETKCCTGRSSRNVDQKYLDMYSIHVTLTGADFNVTSARDKLDLVCQASGS